MMLHFPQLRTSLSGLTHFEPQQMNGLPQLVGSHPPPLELDEAPVLALVLVVVLALVLVVDEAPVLDEVPAPVPEVDAGPPPFPVVDEDPGAPPLPTLMSPPHAARIVVPTAQRIGTP